MRWEHSRWRVVLPFFVAGLMCATGFCCLSPVRAQAAEQEFYELRIYHIENADKQTLVHDYLQNALLPALLRLSIDRVGIFTRLDPGWMAIGDDTDFSIFMVIPYSKADDFVSMRAKLASDSEYQKAAAEYFARPLKDPVYQRIESRFMKAFAGMPVIEMPKQSKNKAPRIFELRLYESHTEDAAARKVDMFNEGEIDLMREVEMSPVFYGETLIGSDVPNLVYMLSADDMESHQSHWKAFLAHPTWERMKGMEKYKDTVSKIKNWFLEPTSYSQM